jgi:uncharacterized repeat protein (TIGR01451 family)
MANIQGRLEYDGARAGVTSASLAGIAGVAIVLQNTSTGLGLAVLTASDGSYTFTNVPNGSYQVVESYGTPAAFTATADFSNATVMDMLNGGTPPPISFVSGAPEGATNLDDTTRSTRLVTVSGANLTNQDFANGPVLYTPITTILDTSAVVDPTNLFASFDNGTFGSFPAGTTGNTGANPNPYPAIGSAFIYTLPTTGAASAVSPIDGDYTIQNLMNNSHSNTADTWWRVADHTTGTEMGRMMVVNGANPNAVILTEVATVEVDSYYIFTAWILNLCKKIPNYANPAFAVTVTAADGTILYNDTLGNLIPINTEYPEWKQIGTVIYSGENTTLTLQFTSMGPAATGNDFIIDDISLNEISFPVYTPTKSVDHNVIPVGGQVTFTILMQNPTQNPFTNVFFADPVPAGLAFNAGSVIVNGVTMTGADPNVGFVVPDIASGDTLVVSFIATATAIPDPNPTTNTANVAYSYSPVAGGIPTCYKTSTNPVDVEVIAPPVVVVVDTADLGIVKTASTTLVTPNGSLSYNLVVTNNGPNNAVNVIVNDPIPPQLITPAYSVDGGAFAPWTGTYNTGTLAVGDTFTITITATVDPNAMDGTVINTATVKSDTPDPNTDNNTSTVEIPIEPPPIVPPPPPIVPPPVPPRKPKPHVKPLPCLCAPKVHCGYCNCCCNETPCGVCQTRNTVSCWDIVTDFICDHI